MNTRLKYYFWGKRISSEKTNSHICIRFWLQRPKADGAF